MIISGLCLHNLDVVIVSYLCLFINLKEYSRKNFCSWHHYKKNKAIQAGKVHQMCLALQNKLGVTKIVAKDIYCNNKRIIQICKQILDMKMVCHVYRLGLGFYISHGCMGENNRLNYVIYIS